MHRPRILALALLLLAPQGLAAPPVPAPPGPSLEAPPLPATLPVGQPHAFDLVVRMEGPAGSPPPPREVRLRADAAPHAAALAPNPLRLGPGQAEGTVRVTLEPLDVGPLLLRIVASAGVAGGASNLTLTTTVAPDPLRVLGLAADPARDLEVPLRALLATTALPREPVGWSVEASHEPAPGAAPFVWTAAEGATVADPGGAPWNATFLARHGPGAYALTLRAGGGRTAPAEVRLAVALSQDEPPALPFVLDVQDAPASLALANDTVNADGKQKNPGSPLLTRVVVKDPDGLAGLGPLNFTYARLDPAGPVAVETHLVPVPAQGTQATVEGAFATSPMAAGAYVCTVTLEGAGSVQRTFQVLDTKPTATLVLANATVLPAGPATLEGTLRVGDANFGTGPLDPTDVRALGALKLAVYKGLTGSAVVASQGWALDAGNATGATQLALDLAGEGTRSTLWPYEVRDGKGWVAIPVRVHVPSGADPGTFRVRAWDNATLASAPFDVRPLPRVLSLAPGPAAAPGAALDFTVDLAPGDGLHALRLVAPWGALTAEPGELTPFGGGMRWQGTLPIPRPLDDDTPLHLLALADLGDGQVVVDPAGKPVNAASAPLPVANAPPTLEAGLEVDGVPAQGPVWLHPRAAAVLRIVARAADDNAEHPDLLDEVGPLEAEVRRWDGALVAWNLTGSAAPGGASLVVAWPPDAAPGRYAVRVRARDDDNASAERTLALDLGTRFRVAASAPGGAVRFAPSGDGSFAAEVAVRNEGTEPAGGLVVMLEGLPAGTSAEAALVLHGARLTLPLQEGFARFEGLAFPAGAEAALRLAARVAPGTPPGAHAGRLLVAGEPA